MITITDDSDLKEYESECLRRMYDELIINNAYKPVVRLHSLLSWSEVQEKYGKGIKGTLDSLFKKGLVQYRKSRAVVSLTKYGVLYVVGKYGRGQH